MAIKLNMSKAYDKVECDFLEAIIRKLGFADQRISLIMTCVKYMTYSILITGPLKDALSLREVFVKVTLSPLTCFSYVQKV